MLSVSLPYHALVSGTGLGSETFLEQLAESGVQSIELRVVWPDEEPQTVLTAARRVWERGLRISVHTVPRTAEGAAADIFRPLKDTLKAERQENTILVMHPVNGEDPVSVNQSVMETLSAYLRENSIAAKLALENNRKMPDRSEGDCAALVSSVIREMDPQYCGICFDFGHFAWASKVWEQSETLLPPESFRSRIIHTHIHALSGPELNYKTHFPLQYGSLPLEEYVSSFRNTYSGVYNLELEPERFTQLMSGSEAILGSVAALKQRI